MRLPFLDTHLLEVVCEYLDNSSKLELEGNILGSKGVSEVIKGYSKPIRSLGSGDSNGST